MFNFKNNTGFYDMPDEVKSETKYVSRFFFCFTLSYFVVYAILVVAASYVGTFNLSEKTFRILNLLFTQFIMIAVYALVKLLTANMNTAKHPIMSKMTISAFLKIMAISVFILVIGSVLGQNAAKVVNKVFGVMPNNYVSDSVMEMTIAEIVIFVVVLAPVFEELVFRKLMIDKLAKYGTCFSVMVSAFVFGIMHANLYQFFYAYGLGVLLGYVYCIYGKILYPIVIHAIINFFGSIVPLAMGLSETGHITFAQQAYVTIYMILFFCGGILVFKNRRKLISYSVEGVLISPGKLIYKSWGFVLCIAMFMTELILNTIK